jgi:hypothetical protein
VWGRAPWTETWGGGCDPEWTAGERGRHRATHAEPGRATRRAREVFPSAHTQAAFSVTAVAVRTSCAEGSPVGNPTPIEVDCPPSWAAKAEEVSTDSGPPRPGRSPAASACEPYHELIGAARARGRNAMAIWQDLVDGHGFPAHSAPDRRPGAGVVGWRRHRALRRVAHRAGVRGAKFRSPGAGSAALWGVRARPRRGKLGGVAGPRRRVRCALGCGARQAVCQPVTYRRRPAPPVCGRPKAHEPLLRDPAAVDR